MRSRQTLLEIFTTFLQFQEDSFRGWATDTRLRRSMQMSLKQFADASSSEQFWSVYWHKQWRGGDRERGRGGEGEGKGDRKGKSEDSPSSSSPPSSSSLLTPHSSLLSLAHLSAYLQEACYWSAQRTVARLDRSQHGLSDCFQVAISAVPKILKAFDSDQLPSLKTYASTAFSNVIRDDLRRRREADRCNEWGLLLKLSRKQLIESLQNAGLGAEEIDRHILAWTCFEAVYIPQKSPGLRQLAAPNRETWEAIAQRYNQQRRQLTSPGSEYSPEALERLLIFCTGRVRAYLYPTISSLNAPRLGQEGGELQDDVPDSRDTLLADLIADEDTQARQAQQTQLATVLKDALAKLDPSLQELLQLYYQEKLTQQQIAQQLTLQQYTVSRKLTKARETLLLALTRWSQVTLHTSPTSNVVKYISAVLEEWLQIHYQGSDPN